MICRVYVHGLIMSGFIFIGLLLCTLLILLILFAITSTIVSSFFSFPSFSFCSNVLNICLDIHLGDCKDQYGEKGRCVVAAIYNYTNQLLDYGKETPCKPFLTTLKFHIYPWCFSLYHICYMLLLTNQILVPHVKIILSDNLTQALLFLSHFMGDVHQVCIYNKAPSILLIVELIF